MKFTIEFEFLSLSSMNSDSEFSSGLFPVLLFLFNFFLRKILKRTRGSVATLQDATYCPDAAVLLCPCASCLQTTGFVTHFRILLTVEHCDHCEHEIRNRRLSSWAWSHKNSRFWVRIWSFSWASFSFEFLSPQDLERTWGSVAALQDATNCPDAAVSDGVHAPAVMQTTHFLATLGYCSLQNIVIIVSMKFTIEFEFLSLSSMNSHSEFSAGAFSFGSEPNIVRRKPSWENKSFSCHCPDEAVLLINPCASCLQTRHLVAL